MSKRKKIYAILFVIVIFGCLWAFISAAVITKNFKADILSNSLEKEELHAKGIFATESREGQKYWEIYADDGQMDSESKVATLYHPIGNFYKDGEVVMSFKSSKGTYSEETKKITLYEDTLILHKDGTQVTADKLIWQGQDNDIFAKGHVVISRLDGKFLITSNEATLKNNMTRFAVIGNSVSKIFDSNGVELK